MVAGSHGSLGSIDFYIIEGAPDVPRIRWNLPRVLQYSRTPRQIDSSDVSRSLQEIVQRFMNACILACSAAPSGALDPPPKKTAESTSALAQGESCRACCHKRIHNPAGRRRYQGCLSMKQEEELVSGEVSADVFGYDVLDVRAFRNSRTFSLNGPTAHLLFLFDVAEVEQSGAGTAFSSPPLGSLVSEWVFDTDPLEHARPVIRPRSGSDRLTSFMTAQAGLFECHYLLNNGLLFCRNVGGHA